MTAKVVKQKILDWIIKTVNLNTILLALIAGYFAKRNANMDSKQDVQIAKQDTVRRNQGESKMLLKTLINKVDVLSIRFNDHLEQDDARMDTVQANQQAQGEEIKMLYTLYSHH